MSNPVQWGIIGLGRIAHKFAQDLAGMPDARLSAVASRSAERASAFAQAYGARFAYGRYEDIVTCPELDVVYIATPHVSHCANTLLCLEHRIPVLCEKPFAMNAAEVQQMTRAAQRNQTFLMEALWTRFLPTTQKVLELLEEGAIGKLLSVKADFGFRPQFDPGSRLFAPELGGGSLLDIGIYPVFLSLLLFGKPSSIRALAHIGSAGVDEECGILLQYPEGQMAHLHATFRAKTKTEAFLYGEKGTLHWHTRWHEPTSLSLFAEGRRPQVFHFDYTTNGYSYEAAEVMDCLAQGRLESNRMPLSFSLGLMQLLDAIRQEAGIIYPTDPSSKIS